MININGYIISISCIIRIKPAIVKETINSAPPIPLFFAKFNSTRLKYIAVGIINISAFNPIYFMLSLCFYIMHHPINIIIYKIIPKNKQPPKFIKKLLFMPYAFIELDKFYIKSSGIA